MAENAIDAIRSAEAKADEVLRKASAEAAQKVDEAYAEVIRLDNAAADAASHAAADRIAAAHKASQAALEQAQLDLRDEVEQFEAAARARQPEAVRQILEALGG